MARPKKRKIESKTYFDEQKASELINDPILYKVHSKLTQEHYEDGSLFREKDDGVMSSKAMHDLFHFAEEHNVNFLTLVASGYLRRKSKEIWHNLTDTQLEVLLPLFNHNFFVEALTASELKEVFERKRTAKVKNIGVLAYTLNQLSKQGFLADNWQHQAEQGKMFVTSKGTPLKAKKLSSKLSEFNDQITAYTDMYSEADIPRTYKAKMRLKNDIDNLIASL